jgi:hypothetical protein
MATALAPTTGHWTEQSVFELGQRLAQLLSDASQEATGGQLPDVLRERVADLAEAIRRRTAETAERDPRSLFDLDDRLIELMDRAEEEASDSGEVSETLQVEITEYLDAFRGKADRIAGYWRWQEWIARICGEEVDRLSARKKAADSRVNRLKSMLLTFMVSRGSKKLEGEKTCIGMQPNSNPLLVVDDPLQIGDGFYEHQTRLTKPEVREIVHRLTDGELRRRMEFVLQGDQWEMNTSAVRAALVTNAAVQGARLVKGHHVRIR